MKHFLCLVVLFITVFLPGVATATPTLWSGAESTGNYYEIFEITYLQGADGLNKTDITWEEARDWANTLTHVNGNQTYVGHLATITSEAENTFIYDLRNNAPNNNYMLGGFQDTSASTSDSGWQWVVSDDNWDYTNWRGNEPNNSFGYTYPNLHPGNGLPEYYLEIDFNSGGTWNDVLIGAYTSTDGNNESLFNNGKGYIVEYELAAGTAPVPEPATMMLFGIGLLGIAGVTRSKK